MLSNGIFIRVHLCPSVVCIPSTAVFRVKNWGVAQEGLMQEEGNPFLGGSEIVLGSAAQFAMGTGDSDQIGPAKRGQDAGMSFRFRRSMSNFHAGSMAKPVGQMPSR
jgi:hypothetical protein